SCSCSSYGDPLDLHSFPTRRSSDLMIRPLPVIAAFVLIVTGCSSPSNLPDDTYGSASQQQRMEQDTTMGPSMGGGWNDGQGYKGDRKSTRLNSSHVKISYAVFCLKK